MAIAVSYTDGTVNPNSGTSSSPTSRTITAGGSDTCVLFGVVARNASTDVHSSATWNGNAMTKVASVNAYIYESATIWLYAASSITTGTSCSGVLTSSLGWWTRAITYSGTATSSGSAIGSTGTYGNPSSADVNSASVTINADDSGSWAVASIANRSGGTLTATSGTRRGDGTSMCFFDSNSAPAGNYTLSASGSMGFWTEVAFELLAPGGGGGTVTPILCNLSLLGVS